jgi:uncharacterized protein (DUF2267 family)
MSSGLDSIDKTVQTTNVWINDVVEEIGPDRQLAWRVLGAVLRNLRDRMPATLASHLGAQLPTLIRGIYYDQYQPEREPETTRSLDVFLDAIADELADMRPVDTAQATRAVFHVLSRHVDRGQAAKIRESLPREIRVLWPDSFLSEAPARAPARVI